MSIPRNISLLAPNITASGVLSIAAGGTSATTATGSGALVLSVSPTFTGAPLAPTAVSGTNTTQLATTAFVKLAIDGIVNAAPSSLDTLNELAAALGNDSNFATTVTNNIALKAPLTGVGASGTWGISITGNAASLSTTLTLAKGGTGATTVSAAQVNLQVDPSGTAIAMAIALG